MKAVLLSLTLFGLLFLLATLNCRYLETVTETLLQKEALFPDKEKEKNAPAEALVSAGEYWYTASRRLSNTVHTRYLNAVTTAFDNVISYYENGSVSDYLAARRQLTEALRSLQRADALTVASII